MKRLLRKLWVFILLAPGSVFAATTNPDLDPEAYKPMIQIPGFEGFSKVTKDAANSAAIQVPYIGEYIGALYKFSLGAGAIVAAFMITVGGFQYVTAGAIPKNLTAAKQRITNALVGLLLLIGSYVVLYSLNPDLVAMKSISILSAQKIQLQDKGTEGTGVGDGVQRSTEFDASFDVANCPSLVSTDPSGVRFGGNAHHALHKAAAEALTQANTDWINATESKGISFLINRDYRTTAEQQYLYDLYKAGKGPVAAEPGKSNHERGNAVDISTAGLGGSTAAYTKLVQILEKNGFKVLGDGTYNSSNIPDGWNTISERWHFDYTKASLADKSTVQCNTPATGTPSTTTP